MQTSEFKTQNGCLGKQVGVGVTVGNMVGVTVGVGVSVGVSVSVGVGVIVRVGVGVSVRIGVVVGVSVKLGVVVGVSVDVGVGVIVGATHRHITRFLKLLLGSDIVLFWQFPSGEKRNDLTVKPALSPLA